MKRLRPASLLCAVMLLAGCRDEGPTPVGALPAAPVAARASAEGFPSPGELRTGYVLDRSGRPTRIGFEVQGGRAIWEGDIDLGPAASIAASAEELTRSGGARLGVVINTAGSRWPGGVVPYVIASNLPSQQRVHDAIAHIEAVTGQIDFVPRTTQADYVLVRPSTGCSSSVGRVGGVQYVDLASGCSTGSTIHELLHAAGMWHEQSRCDRNGFVTINWGNIESGRSHNFNQQCTGALDLFDYDEGSIMHYGAYAFSANNLPTITSLRGRDWQMGQRNALSAADVATVDWMYPVPFSVTLSGKQYVTRYESAQYTATVSGGTAPYTYEWRTRQSGPGTSGTWSSWYGTGTTNTNYASINACGLNTNYLEVRATDAAGRQTTGSYTIYITNPC